MTPPIDPITPPDGEGREWHPVNCLGGCGRFRTMHRTGLCHVCGDWLTRLDANSAQPGDLLLWGRWWWGITGVARTVNHNGQHVVRFSLENCKTMDLYPDAECIVATSHRPVVAA